METTKPVRVLLIEGDPSDASIVASYLAPGGDGGAFTVEHASRLSTACHLLGRESFDAALLDLNVPHCVGLEGFLKIRSMRPALPVVVLTSLVDKALAAQAVALGAQDYLVKGTPDCFLLKRAVRHAIEKKTLMDAAEELKTRLAALETRPAGPSAEELGRLRDEMRESLRVVEVKNHFMSRVSHELRNTLATLKTAAYCLKDAAPGTLSPRQARLVDMISRNVDRQGKIVDNILDLARFQSGKLKIQLRPVDAAAVISDLVQEYSLSPAGRKLHVEVHGPLPSVDGDPDLIAQVLRNLVDNSLRYAKERVVIRATPCEPAGVAISVADDGTGIPPERLGDLFTQFVQLDRPSTGHGYKGTGLGLTICKEIVEGHKGRIWAENSAGHGARFTFTLPASAGVPAPAAEPERQLVTRD
jgi:signal transduction histidine kinase